MQVDHERRQVVCVEVPRLRKQLPRQVWIVQLITGLRVVAWHQARYQALGGRRRGAPDGPNDPFHILTVCQGLAEQHVIQRGRSDPHLDERQAAERRFVQQRVARVERRVSLCVDAHHVQLAVVEPDQPRLLVLDVGQHQPLDEPRFVRAVPVPADQVDPRQLRQPTVGVVGEAERPCPDGRVAPAIVGQHLVQLGDANVPGGQIQGPRRHGLVQHYLQPVVVDHYQTLRLGHIPFHELGPAHDAVEGQTRAAPGRTVLRPSPVLPVLLEVGRVIGVPS